MRTVPLTSNPTNTLNRASERHKGSEQRWKCRRLWRSAQWWWWGELTLCRARVSCSMSSTGDMGNFSGDAGEQPVLRLPVIPCNVPCNAEFHSIVFSSRFSNSLIGFTGTKQKFFPFQSMPLQSWKHPSVGFYSWHKRLDSIVHY